jgi:hypothetical protein
VRQAHARDGNAREQLIEQRRVKISGERAQQDAERKAEEHRGQRELERISKRAEQLLGDRLVRENRDAEVAARHGLQPAQILNMDRLVEAEARTDHVRDFLARLGRNQYVSGVSRHHLHQREHDERRAEQDRHGIEHAACDEEPHE